MRSLRLRLFVLLLALAALAALAVGGATYAGVRAEADALFDYQLRQMALSLRDQGRIAEDERAALADPELDYVVQIWSLDGVQLYSSRPRPLSGPLSGTLPPRAVLGFTTARIEGREWRVYGAATPFRVVQVGQPLAVRRQFAAAAAGRSVLPIVIAVPLLGLAVWWLVGATLAPLRRVVAAAGAREPHSLQPLPLAGLPSELLPLVQAFNALLARLGSAFDAQRAFVGDAAHELRTPLTALKLQLELLRTAADDAQRDDALQRLRAGVDRASRLAEQLLALARAEPGQALPMAPLDLVAVARQALADAAPLAQAQRARLDIDAPESLDVRGNAEALRSLLRNLLDNAVLHGGAQVRLTLRRGVDDGDRSACAQVDDDGPGIPEAEREGVFDRFHRREGDGAAAAPGSGLGLAIARAVARQHGGTLRLLDSPLSGLRAELRLPAGICVQPAVPLG
ncbi:MAG: ATP-binding protein [Rubrivivax sp.]